MYQGNSSFVTMKGFGGDFVFKGDGHEPETLPVEEPIPDVAESAELDDAGADVPLASNIKPTDNKTGAPSTTMSPELQEVADKAEEDIADGYVADIQHLPGPGDREVKAYEAFNDLIMKTHSMSGAGFNKYDIDGSFAEIQKGADLAFDRYARDTSGWLCVKELDDSLVVKGDPEDVNLEQGYVEEGDAPVDFEEAQDDTESVQGENETAPQTAEAKVEDEEGTSAVPAELSDEGTQALGDTPDHDQEVKGWMAYERMIQKGFQLEEKGVKERASQAWDAIKRAGRYVGEKAKTADKYARGEAGSTRRKVTNIGLASAAGVGAGYGGYRGYKRLKKKGFEDYDNTIATKGFEIEEKGVKERASQAWDAVKRAGRYVGEKGKAAGRKTWETAKATPAHLKRNAALYGAGVGGAALGAGGGYAYDRYRRKGFEDYDNTIATKGFEIEEKVFGALRRAAEATGKKVESALKNRAIKVGGTVNPGEKDRGKKYVEAARFVARHPGKVGAAIYGAGALGAAGAGYGGYRALKKKS